MSNVLGSIVDIKAICAGAKGVPVAVDGSQSAVHFGVDVRDLGAVTHAYTHEYANVHRGLHTLSNIATDNFESVRGKIARFLNAEYEDEIFFTRVRLKRLT